MDSSVEGEAGSSPASLSFSGRLTVDRAAELRARFTEALARPESLAVDVAGATEVDITFLQLLYAAHKAARLAGKTLTLSPLHPPAMQKALAQAGLCGHAGLCSDGGQPCLWTGGSTP
jgi:anti-anti-sigma regulatory factor